jgi:hypothetical protein
MPEPILTVEGLHAGYGATGLRRAATAVCELLHIR